MSRLRSNKVVNQAGSGAPELTYGAVVPGTGTISGAGSINVTGIITATSFSGPVTGGVTGDVNGNVTGNLTGDVTGNLTGNVTGNVTGNTSGTAGSLAAGATGADLTLSGNLTVNGTTTTIDTATLNIEDRNIGIASVSNPSDTTADGAGLTIFAGADGNKILQWVNIGDGKWQFVGGTVEASNFVKSDGTPVAGDSDITSCLFV